MTNPLKTTATAPTTTEQYETLRVRRVGAVAVVLLDRPPVNAVSTVMKRELQEVFEQLSESRDVACVVLGSANPNIFCGGIDLKEVPPQAEDLSVSAILDPGAAWRAAQTAIRHCSVPVIGAIEGPAIGAGFGMVGVCDFLFASSTARFALTEVKVGMLGGASKVLRMMGPYKARRMMFTGEYESAEELYRFGVIEEITAPGEALSRAIEFAQSMAGTSPIALRLAKESILRIEGHLVEDQYRTEQDYTLRMKRYDDAAEARRAFAEKREPKWNWS